MNYQSAAAVLLVRPHGFGFDTETASTNSFQKNLHVSRSIINKRVEREFEALVDALRAKDITVVIGEYAKHETPKPNAIFVNNWLSTWPSGDVYTYPMAHEHRRHERTLSIVHELSRNFEVRRYFDLSDSEVSGNYLESTGVMIFDHLQKIVYGCVSSRCDPALFRAHAGDLGYEPVLFHAYDSGANEIYHTNVMMALQTETAILCADAITDLAERKSVLKKLEASGRDIVLISRKQMSNFCANALEVRNGMNQRFMAMSKTAYESFTEHQLQALKQDKQIIRSSIPTIEALGGGSVRCMLAEIFLPAK